MKQHPLVKTLMALVIMSFTLTGCYLLAGQWLDMGNPDNRVVVAKNVMVPMRDGIHLATDVYRPAGDVKPLPVILTRLPYNKNNMKQVGRLFAERGYVMVIQDCRACFASEGDVFVPILYEHDDGMDTVNWIAEQPWFNGNLGTWGPSYLGITQWAVIDDNPYLKASYPQITSGKMNLITFQGGAFQYRLTTGWSASVGKQHAPDQGDQDDDGTDQANMAKGFLKMMTPGKDKDNPEVMGGLFNLPLQPDVDIDWEDVARYSVQDLAVKLGFTEPGTDKPSPDAVDKMIKLLNYPAFALYSDAFNFKDRYQNVHAPALMVSGWYDMFLGGQLEDFQQMKALAPGDAGRCTRIIIGPWGHVTGKHPTAGRDAGIDDMMKLFMNVDWYDHWLKGESNGAEQGPSVRIYVMNKNVWRDEQQWPLPRTRYTNYYLHGHGAANSASGDGTISTHTPADEPSDAFTYDPVHPVPTMGGNNLLENVGAKEQKEVEARRDVLVYTSEPLTQDLEITGPVKAVIYAASSAVDTDFTVKLCDVYPDGKSLNVVDGIVRARYRDSFTDPSLIEPGKVYAYEIDLWATSTCFLKGHRIRVQVSSSNFPRFDRNSNAGGQGGPDHYVAAEQTILHDADHPSHLILPVIP